MKAILTFLLAVTVCFTAKAYRYSYSFDNTPLSEAIVSLLKNHKDINISFIYKELDNYRTSAKINTDDAYDALLRIVGQNPVSVIKKDKIFYIEALQHGKFRYTGKVIDNDNEAVVAATVMLLAPKDSTVITYGITDNTGRFSIPCDRQDVIGKISCLGYKTYLKKFETFALGTIVIYEQAIALGAMSVAADNSMLLSDKSIYLPTARQKKSAQTAQDLISRMAIPQLRPGDELLTTTGLPVDIFIDFMPASAGELAGMRIDDVKYIEYYDHPADPRFQGKPHVLNFIMQKYICGGYIKGIYYDNFVTSRQINGYAKVQYKDMTFDWAGGAFYMNDKLAYENTEETFRLPQTDGSIKEIERISTVNKSRKRSDTYWNSIKALYRTDNVSISNMITADFSRTPKHMTSGTVSYSPESFGSDDYEQLNSDKINSFIYNGYWYFKLPGGNLLTFNPEYAYTHTRQNSDYVEYGTKAYANSAVDHSHQASGNISFVHSFGNAGTLKAMCRGNFLRNRTRYYGTSTTSDKAMTYRIGPTLNYSYSNDSFYGSVEAGLHWDRSSYSDIKKTSTAPWFNISLQYALNRKNSLALDFSYGKSIPASSYRSAALVQSDPMMSYTGNPALVPYNSCQIEGYYTLIPNNRFNISAFAYVWIVNNRYVFDYEAKTDGIIRTIKQPMGDYAQWQYGLQSSVKTLEDRLHLNVSCYLDQTYNGTPYNWNKSKLSASVSANYYLDKVYFGATYDSPSGYADGCMTGIWTMPRYNYSFQIGWSDKDWNLRFFTRNFLRYNTYQTKGIMKSKYYDSTHYIFSSSYVAFFQISATYTFGFGKKISAKNEAYQAAGASSGILNKN